VTDSSAQGGSRRHRLTTFGTLALAGPADDIVLGEHGHHRRRLALLAVLAASGDRGRSRDQLLPLFWPEATQARARHSLDQLLYALRGSIDESVFAGVNPLRLNAEVIESDVGAFRAALEQGDLEAAVATYHGPFLDGFYLSDAPEFERWVDGERFRLAGLHTEALERLARDATAAGQHDVAARWWKQLTDVEPLSSRSAAGLIRALVATDDHAAALQFAKRYEAMLASELGASVDPTIASLVAEVRAGAQAARGAHHGVPRPAERREHDTPGVAALLPDVALHTGTQPPRRERRAGRLIHLGAVSLAITIAAAALLRGRADVPAAHTARGSTRNVAAYELYLRGSDPAALRSDSAARVGLRQFEQAVALDERYAAAWAGLALMQLRVPGDSLVSHRDRLAIAEQAALRAVALDDSLADAHAALSFVRSSNLDLASAESEMRRAVELDPSSARMREWLAQLYVTAGQPARALAEARRALELDPLSPTAVAEVAHALLANDRCDEALAQLAPLRSLRPPLLRAGTITVQCFARKGMWPEAIAEARPVASGGGARGRSLLGWALARAGHSEEARRVLISLVDDAQRVDGGAFDVAVVYAGLGDNDQAFAWLDRAMDERSLLPMHHFGLIRELASDPRFDHVRDRMRIAQR
jgi:DNA-binding SARP family transcriptional activator